MPGALLLDTNCLALLLKRPVPQAAINILSLGVPLCAPEIVMMEIYSVLGKYRRMQKTCVDKCKRTVIDDFGAKKECCHSWFQIHSKRINRAQYSDLRKLLVQIEDGVGPLQLTVLPISTDVVNFGKSYLSYYSDKCNFGSHDAMIAGFQAHYSQRFSYKLKMATCDRGLKQLLIAAKLPYIDPEQITPRVA